MIAGIGRRLTHIILFKSANIASKPAQRATVIAQAQSLLPALTDHGLGCFHLPSGGIDEINGDVNLGRAAVAANGKTFEAEASAGTFSFLHMGNCALDQQLRRRHSTDFRRLLAAGGAAGRGKILLGNRRSAHICLAKNDKFSTLHQLICENSSPCIAEIPAPSPIRLVFEFIDHN